jgi:hypothetical protein
VTQRVECVHRALWSLWPGSQSHCTDQDALDLSVEHRLPWFHTHNPTTGPQCVVFVPCLGRNEVILINRLQLSWLHFFICIKCIIFLVLKAICRT